MRGRGPRCARARLLRRSMPTASSPVEAQRAHVEGDPRSRLETDGRSMSPHVVHVAPTARERQCCRCWGVDGRYLGDGLDHWTLGSLALSTTNTDPLRRVLKGRRATSSGWSRDLRRRTPRPTSIRARRSSDLKRPLWMSTWDARTGFAFTANAPTRAVPPGRPVLCARCPVHHGCFCRCSSTCLTRGSRGGLRGCQGNRWAELLYCGGAPSSSGDIERGNAATNACATKHSSAAVLVFMMTSLSR